MTPFIREMKEVSEAQLKKDVASTPTYHMRYILFSNYINADFELDDQIIITITIGLN